MDECLVFMQNCPWEVGQTVPCEYFLGDKSSIKILSVEH